MLDKYQIVHDLALVYAQEQYREFIRNTPESKRLFPTDASKLASLYESGVVCFVNRLDNLTAAYLDDDGNSAIGD